MTLTNNPADLLVLAKHRMIKLRRRTVTAFVLPLILAAGWPGAVAAQLVINEIDYDQPGTDTAEFLEIYNAGGSSVDLSTYTVELVNGNGGSIYQTVTLPATSLAAGDFFVVCSDVSTVANCDLDTINSIQNGAPDAVALRNSGVLVDTVSYEGDTVAPYTEGSGAGLVDDSSGGAGGINEYKSISRVPDGADTNQNNQDFSLRCMSPGEANLTTSSDCLPAPVVKLVINEIDYRQPGGDGAEFVELYNSGNTIVNLDGYAVELVDGATGNAYLSFALPDVDLPASEYYVLCGDPLAVNLCDLDIAVVADFIQDGSPDAVALTLDTVVVDAVSYDGDAPAPYLEGSGTGLVDPAADGSAGLSRFPDGNDSDRNNVDLSVRCTTPGAANTSVGTACEGGAGVEIFAIQGSGLSSPLEAQVVTTNDNIVTAVGTEGFFIQTPAARSDGDSETSDGIYVFTGGAPGVSVGDQVDVTGVVDEFFDFTEITNSPLVSVDSSGNALPAPVVLDASTPSPLQPQPATELERFEGMLVSFAGITTGPTDQFGDTPVTAGLVRTFREPGIEFPGLPGLPVWDGNPEVFEVDVAGLLLPDQPLFANQAVSVEGPLAFSFGDYIVWPTSFSAGAPAPLPVGVDARAPGEFTVAMQNMLRLFDTVDDPLVDDAVTPPADYQARLIKASLHFRSTLDAPDVIALQEVENLQVLQDLAAQIATDQPGLIYAAHLLEGNDVGGIDVGYLTREDTVNVLGLSQSGANTIFAFDGSLLNDRPPLVMDLDYVGNGAPFALTVINVHQRSLGGIEGNEATRVKNKRLEQARELATLMQDMQIADPTRRIVVIGDFNAFQFTDGYVDVMGQVTGQLDPLGDELATTDIVNPDYTNQILALPAVERYSFVFGGNAQALDHVLTSASLAGNVTGMQFARGNADASNSLLLATGPGTPPIVDNTPLRIADHDAGVLYLVSDADADGLADNADNCTLVSNADQTDTDSDGIGNACDLDASQDCEVGFAELNALKLAFFSLLGDAAYDVNLDFDGDGEIGFLDLNLLKLAFFTDPGPSGVPNICDI